MLKNIIFQINLLNFRFIKENSFHGNNNKKKFLKAANQHFRMISEGSRHLRLKQWC